MSQKIKILFFKNNFLKISKMKKISFENMLKTSDFDKSRLSVNRLFRQMEVLGYSTISTKRYRHFSQIEIVGEPTNLDFRQIVFIDKSRIVDFDKSRFLTNRLFRQIKIFGSSSITKNSPRDFGGNYL